MKKRPIGDIARGIGLSATVREVQADGEPILLTKGKEVVAMLAPCNDMMARYMEDSVTLGKVVKLLSKDSEQAVKEYLLYQMMTGFIAKMALTASLGEAELVADLERKIGARLLDSLTNRTEDRATVGTDPSAVPMESKSRRRKPAALPKRGSPPKR